MSSPLFSAKQAKFNSGGIDLSDYLDESNAFEEAQKFFQSSKPSAVAIEQPNNSNYETEKQRKRLSQFGVGGLRHSVIKDGKVSSKSIEIGTDDEESLLDVVKGRLKASYSRLHDQKNKIINNLVSQTHIGGIGLVHEEKEMEKLLELESQLKAESSRLEAERQEIAISLRSQKREQIEALEKSVQDDVLELEMNRREIEKDLEKKKITIEKLHSELQETDLELDLSNKSLSSNSKGGANLKDNKQRVNSRIKEAFDLAQEYVETLAESKAKVSVANEEMKLIQQGRVPVFDNINNRSTDSNSKPNNMTDKAYEIINSNSSTLEDQVKRIESLKENAAKEAESLKEIDFYELSSHVSIPNGESADVTKILGDLKEGNVSATDYLNKWLMNSENVSKTVDVKSSNISNKRELSTKSYPSNGVNVNKDESLSAKHNASNNLLQTETSLQSVIPNDESVSSQKPNDSAESVAFRSMIQQLNDEIKQLKERQTQQSTANNITPLVNPQMPYNPYNPYNPAMNQFGQLPYIPNNFPSNMIYPNMGAGHFPQIPQDPTQMMMFQQIQKMTEQMEKENSRLMSQLNGLNPQPPSSSDILSSKSLSRDEEGNHTSSRFNRIESKHHEEIRLIKLEMEKLKQQQELEDLKVQIEKHREERLADLEHSKWLAQQKKDLQELKMKQALAKEEKLLSLVQQEPKKETEKLNPLLVEEAGVGSTLLPFDVIKGAVVAVDCLYLPKGLHEGHSFRIAAAIYDSSGKNITKLVASEWQEWDKSPENDVSSLQFVNNPVKRTAKIDDKPPLTINSKVLIEIQLKLDKDTSAQKSLGWSTMRIVGPNPPDSSMFLSNGLWRLPILSGTADPVIDPFSITAPSVGQQKGFLFIRVADSNNTAVVNSWMPKIVFSSNTSINPMQVYLDPKQCISDERRPSSAARPPTSSKQPSRPPTSQSIKQLSRPGTAIKSVSEAQSMLAIDESPEEEEDQIPLNKKDDIIPWLLGTPCGPAVERYQPGDGIDIYVDSAMFLPDNCTISRVVVKLFTSEKELIGMAYEGYSILTSPNISPVFKLKVELRASGNLNTTATALLRFDTIDVVTLQPSSIGYTCFKIFCSQDRKQCTSVADPEALVNTGLFQLPIKTGRIPPLDNFSDNMLKTLIRVPCATVLVRIMMAPKSGDGMTVLSKEDFPREEWVKLKLDVAAPPYNSGAYDGALAEPTPIDRACYIAKGTCPIESVETVIGHTTLMDGDKSSNIPKITAAASPEDKSEWIKLVLPPSDQMRKLINFSYTVPYAVDSGIAVNILSLYNVPDGSGFLSNDAIIYKVIYSMTPPGLYYKEPPLSEGVKFTRLHDFDKPGKAPTFTDGIVIFTPTQMEESLYLLLGYVLSTPRRIFRLIYALFIDIRTLKLDCKNAQDEPVIILEPPVPKKCFWTLLPIAKERTRGQGFIYTASGLYQLPLFEGPVPMADDIFNTPNPLAETITRLESKGNKNIKLSDGSSVLVKIGNPLLKDMLNVDTGADSPDNILQTGLLERLIKASNKGNFPVKKNIFNYDKNTFSINNGFKSTQQLMHKTVDSKKIQKIINKSFAAAANLQYD